MDKSSAPLCRIPLNDVSIQLIVFFTFCLADPVTKCGFDTPSIGAVRGNGVEISVDGNWNNIMKIKIEIYETIVPCFFH
jgi:hypothetical protein